VLSIMFLFLVYRVLERGPEEVVPQGRESQA
jgi:hypothetical protein